MAAAEDRLGLPVTSTAICTTRLMLDHLGLDPVVPHAGALLSGRHPRRPGHAANDGSAATPGRAGA